MAVAFLTNLNEDEFKSFLKQALKELMSDIQNFPSTPVNMDADLLTISQAAEFLKLKVSTLYDKTSLKEIPHFKKGKILYFSKTELQDWINSGKIRLKSQLQDEATHFVLSKNIHSKNTNKTVSSPKNRR